ncbi:MAG: radical SAM protein [Oscillospiraceae bacterium]|nr:radical SAM protein [Oscillospiraceae bacterium]
MIWLVDYTHYDKAIDPRLAKYRLDYFRLKSYVRYNKIGPTAPVKSKVFATGLLRLATILHRNGYDVRYLHYEMLEELLESGAQMPEKVAFSCVCPTVPACAGLAEEIKKRSPKTKVILGGIHVNLSAQLTRERFPVFDQLAVGFEYEAAEQIAGAPLARHNGDYVDYSLLPLPLKEYAINTFTTMGCPYRCSYCADGRAPHFVASRDGQMDQLKKLLPAGNLVHFFDSVLGFSQEGIRNVCDALQKAEHPFLLSCDMRAELLTPELVSAMEKAGFVEVRLGMESADPELLKRNKRTLTVDHFLEKVKMIRENSNLYVCLYSITGLPGTNWDSQQKTLDYCDFLFQEHLVDEIKNAQYVPYPMEGVCYADRGITLLTEDWSQYDRQSFPVYHTDTMSAEELWEIYLHTAKSINESWLRSCGFASFDDVPVIEGYYQEYVEANYLNKKSV